MTQVPSTYATARFGVVTATPLSGLYQVTPLPASPGQFNFANLGVVPPQNETLPITNVTGGTNLPTTGLYQIAAAVTAGQYTSRRSVSMVERRCRRRPRWQRRW